MPIFRLLFLFTLCYVTTACSLDDDDGQPPVVRFVDELIALDDDLTSFRRAMAVSGLDSILADFTPFTLFAPTDAAFATAGVDVEAMDSTAAADFLSYHLIPGLYFGRQNQPDALSYVNTFYDLSPNGGNVPVLIFKQGQDDILLNGSARVVGSELAASNGIVQKINAVLRPPTLLEALRNNDNVSDFAGLVGEAAPLADGSSLADSLNAAGPLTLFLPIDNESTANLTYSAEEKREIVLYHLLGGRNDRLQDFPSRYTTLQGGSINVSGRSLLTGSDQSVLVTLENIQCTNGILHLTDELLLPEGF